MVRDSIIRPSREKFNKVKKRFAHEQLNRTILLFLIVMLPIIAIDLAGRQEIIPIPDAIVKILEWIIVILVSFGGATLFIRLTINLIAGKFEGIGQPEERILFSKLYILLVYVLATVIVFLHIGIGIQNVALFLGLTATGFAFAIRDVVLSYIIWFILLTKKPFKIGDYINVAGEEGQVKHIGMFYVLIDPSPDTYADYTKVPNKVFLEKPIHNYGSYKFLSTFDLYLKSVPTDMIDRLERIRDKGSTLKGADATFYLNSDSDGVKITVEFKTAYEDRNILRDRLMTMMLQELGENA
ncbi:MAG: Mechanosensitive ion channel [Methanomethylovorans sp. PtaU1.Bin093]|uniref:mechanosensitive ion channel domain-containing protein n=1 Tax=Methanomethylovorans sp. PtaU1.Bin093 TaxID=1811679 RepID=UPI0009CE0DDA|nr:mechanosensitive ion channel domain-containing protein [Methanomethylovorans sp. PtaU1.Bin093]OPY21246.1 MAG: Mechanosensitive ion channel [Methanomethylovorans sp. PtaU1.Bin093]